MTEPFEDWNTTTSLHASAKHVHALGAITLLYNDLEHGMSYVFSECISLAQSLSDSIYARLTNKERVDLLRELIAAKERDKSVAEACLHGIKCFEICAENRNTVMHLIQTWSDNRAQNILHAKKRNSDKSREIFYRISSDQLRQVADDILATRQFMRGVVMYLYWRQLQVSGQLKGHELEGRLPNTLPDKPPQPCKLNPLPPPPKT